MKRFVLAAAAVMTLGMPAFAGPQYVDATGYAVSGYDVVAYRSLEQAPVGYEQPAGVPGRADITTEYNGATFAFASEENLAKFLENPNITRLNMTGTVRTACRAAARFPATRTCGGS